MSNFRFTRPDAFPPLVKNLIIINALVFVAQLVLDGQLGLTSILMLQPILPEAVEPLAVRLTGGEYTGFKPYQIATHMFAHGGIGHIFFNMFALYTFGRTLENVWGPQRFLLFYLACGVGAAALHLGIQYLRADGLLAAMEAGDVRGVNRYSGAVASALGASGAIMGVLAAFAYLFPNTELYLMFIPVPLKAKWVVIGLIALDLFGGFASIRGDNIAHFAHLGGALTGFVLVLIWNKKNKRRFY